MKLYIILRNKQLISAPIYQDRIEAEVLCYKFKEEMPENDYEVVEKEVRLSL